MNIRTKNIVKHIKWSFVLKVGSVSANFMLVPLSIKYLGKENYGIWLTLSSVITWFALFDIGLGNGLRNKFAETKALGKTEDAQAFVSTAYYTIAIISTVLVVFIASLNSLVNWSQLFNTEPALNQELSLLLLAVFGFFGVQLVAKLIISVFQADQHHSIQDKFQFTTQILSLSIVWLLTKSNGHSLLLFGSLYAASPVLILLAINFYSFRGRYKAYRPKFRMCKKSYLREITGLGFKFFIIQIAAVILFSTDNFIITRLFGPAEVVPYNIALKYFSIVTMAYSLLIAPYWSSFTEAYTKKDMAWIKHSVSRIQKLWLLIPVTLFFLVLFSDRFYRLWVGESIHVPKILSVAMAVFVAMMTFNMVYTSFINGVGKIRIQLLTSMLSMVINIPLSIFLGHYMGFGPTGVISATCISLGYACILRPLQYYKITNNTAKGIWMK